MEKVLSILPMEINTKANIMMTNIMAKVFINMLMEVNTKVNLKMAK
jgi:hypothetical protein